MSPNEGSDKVSILTTSGFRTPTIYFESHMFLRAVSVLYDHINKKKVVFIRHYVAGNIFGHYV